MALNTEDKKGIAEAVSAALAKNKPEKIANEFDGVKITEWLFRAIVALLLYFGTGVKNEQTKQGEVLQEMKSDISIMKRDKEYETKQINEFESVLSKPRFTKEDFDIGIQPLKNQLNENTTELNGRSGFMSNTEKRLTRMEYLLEEFVAFKKK